MLRKVLVANRGEIALRVIRACRELAVKSVAVYSEPDRASPHVFHADEAYSIGPAPSAESYLAIDRILEVAAAAGCDAVHPGYGFLAENAEFADACESAGLIFVGPPARTIALMGDKTEARRAMQRAGVPVVPGTADPLADLETARRACREIGYPVLLKAAAGGGGKGMRLVRVEDELEAAWGAAGREAQAAFGDPRVYVEKYLERPRHIEVQVLADGQDNVLHLGERECSIQRRHQKLIEESPSPAVTPSLRQRMGETAIAAARSAGYRGAGTVEFLFADGDFYFLEMNTRLQVEHPVTEMVTGIDLVQAQLRIAAGEPLTSEPVRFSGHSIECRITAEDPYNDFLPVVGVVEELRVPSGPGVRWDAGILRGTEISPHYDSLLAKLIVHAPTRAAAISRMARALDELVVSGITTIKSLQRRIMQEPDFVAGHFHTGYLDEHPDLLQSPLGEDELVAAATAAALLEHGERGKVRVDGALAEAPIPPWRRVLISGPDGGWGRR